MSWARTLLPQTPALFKSALSHSLGLSPTSSKLDFKSAMIVAVLRAYFISGGQSGSSIAKQQALTLKDPGIKGKMWISKVTLPPAPENDILDILLKVIEDMKEGSETFTRPTMAPLEAEWTGHRAGVGKEEPRPDLQEPEQYEKLMSETTSSTTILYFHGGAYYLCDPATHRAIVASLCKHTGGSALSIRYRLAPQYAFPNALLDAFTAYLCLLYPPSSSLHAPISPSNIILAGDSAGGNLALALLQLLLQINCSAAPPQTTIFHGTTLPHPLPLPAGIAVSSPWTDLTAALPSNLTNAQFDYLPPLRSNSPTSRFQADALWPTDPPRGTIYCDTSMLCHPLVSPLAVKDWTGAPPMFLACGEELLADECRCVAALAASQGVKVRWEGFEAMPHVFAQLLIQHPSSKKCMKDWAYFCTEAVTAAGPAEVEKELQTRGTWITAKTGEEKAVDVLGLAPCSPEEVDKLMHEYMARRLEGDEKEMKLMPAPKL